MFTANDGSLVLAYDKIIVPKVINNYNYTLIIYTNTTADVAMTIILNIIGCSKINMSIIFAIVLTLTTSLIKAQAPGKL